MSVHQRESGPPANSDAPASKSLDAPASKSDAYRHVRENVTRLVSEHSTAVHRIVPACPAWTVHDLVAHLTQNCLKAVRRAKGQEPAVEPSPSEQDSGVAELLGYWEKRGDELDRIVAAGAAVMSDLLIADAFTHEVDVRYSFGVPLPAAHPAFQMVMAFGAGGIGRSLSSHGLPALRVEADGRSWIAGAGEPQATVSGHPYDLLRSVSGRRTLAQIAELSWSEDPSRWLPAFAWGPFMPPVRTVEHMATVS